MLPGISVFEKRQEGSLLVLFVRNFNALVTEKLPRNLLISSGLGKGLALANFGPIISDISTTPNSIASVSNDPSATSKKNQICIIVGAAVAVVCTVAVLLVLLSCLEEETGTFLREIRSY